MATKEHLSGEARGTVVVYPIRPREPEHERAVHFHIGTWLASMLDMDFGGQYDPEIHYPGRLYFLPTDTLIGLDTARKLGIASEADLFGGVAPEAFMPTKAITHPLVHLQAAAPEGWSQAFGEKVRESVLSGATVFALEDARTAATQLLASGPIRLKPVHATAGRGQVLVSAHHEVETALAGLDLSRLAECGLVLEEHLEAVKTYSVGQVRIAGMVASYVGTQRLTHDNHGVEVYGGSDLTIARGGFEALDALSLPDEARLALAQARAYDAAASECLPGFFASRRNYDIAHGLDAQGRVRCGVLEQSWRTGGASAAEVAAVRRFKEDPGSQVLQASTVEIFGDETPVPEGATELFHGRDPDLGIIRKYVKVEDYGDQQH